MEYQGIHYWRYFYPRGILNPLVKKWETLNLLHFWML
jgi:hypothetical protein